MATHLNPSGCLRLDKVKLKFYPSPSPDRPSAATWYLKIWPDASCITEQNKEGAGDVGFSRASLFLRLWKYLKFTLSKLQLDTEN